MRWLTGLFGRCRHVWQSIRTDSVTSNITGYQVATIHTLQCKECGDIKSRRVGI